jgi:hypothetical protein
VGEISGRQKCAWQKCACQKYGRQHRVFFAFHKRMQSKTDGASPAPSNREARSAHQKVKPADLRSRFLTLMGCTKKRRETLVPWHSESERWRRLTAPLLLQATIPTPARLPFLATSKACWKSLEHDHEKTALHYTVFRRKRTVVRKSRRHDVKKDLECGGRIQPPFQFRRQLRTLVEIQPDPRVSNNAKISH